MSHAEQLERETEQTRSEIANTLDELRACMTPGHVIDQLTDRMSNGAAAAFARNLKNQTVSNPLPIALIGAGLAWLMLAPRGSSDGSLLRSGVERLRGATGDAAENLRRAADAGQGTAAETASEWTENASNLSRDAGASWGASTEAAREAAADAADRARETAGTVVDSAQRMASESADNLGHGAGTMADSMQRSAAAGYRSVQAGAAAGYDAVADRARRAASTVTESTRAAGQRTLETGTTLLDFCREQPLVLAGLGLAAGAMIGALMPSTEIEDRAMGETSDRLKEGAQNLASEQYDAAKKVGEHAIDAAQDEAAKQADKLKAAAETQNGAGEQNEHETKSEEPTLAPAQPAGGEWRGEPWTAENAPR